MFCVKADLFGVVQCSSIGNYLLSNRIVVSYILVYLLCSMMFIGGKVLRQKKVEAIRDLRRLLSKSEIPPVEAALKS